MLAQAGESLILEHLGRGAGERYGHQLALDIQVPAAPERIDSTIAIDGIAIQSQALQVVQPIKTVHGQLGQLVVVHDPGKGKRTRTAQKVSDRTWNPQHREKKGESSSSTYRRFRRGKLSKSPAGSCQMSLFSRKLKA